MTREELNQLTTAAGVVIASRREKHRHSRRGGQRLPGARGGVFTEKINDAERVLATILFQRNIANREVLAELLDVSGRTISDNVREVGPILHSLGHHPDPIPQRHPNADAIRAIAHNTPS